MLFDLYLVNSGSENVKLSLKNMKKLWNLASLALGDLEPSGFLETKKYFNTYKPLDLQPVQKMGQKKKESHFGLGDLQPYDFLDSL